MNNTIKLPINKVYNCDVLVIGAGVAGFSAAVSAARSGAKVILADKNGCIGGTATSGMVGPFMSAMNPTGEKQVIFGFMDEFIRRMEKEGGAIHPQKCKGGDSFSAYRTGGHIGVTPFDIECFKRIAEEICIENGITVMYHLLLISCDKENGKISRAYFATKNGVYAIEAKQFIDCTGDADLAVACGAPTIYGDEDGKTQVSSLFFLVDGIDKIKLDAHMKANPDSTHSAQRYFEKEIENGKKDGTFPCGRHRISTFESVNNIWRINMTQYDIQIDFSDPQQVTNAEIECRRQIPIIIAFLKKNVPGCENIRLLVSSEMLGVRESRRIVGQYTLTQDDVISGRSFEDTIALSGDSIDIHGTTKSIYVTSSLPTQIPFRCLVPVGVGNLLVAGRCVSAEQVALAAVRVMPPCFAMGEAAGIAASLAAQKDIFVGEIPYKELQELLVKNGAFLG